MAQWCLCRGLDAEILGKFRLNPSHFDPGRPMPGIHLSPVQRVPVRQVGKLPLLLC